MLNKKLSALLILVFIVISFFLHKGIYKLLNKFTPAFSIQTITINGATVSRNIDFKTIINSITNIGYANLPAFDIITLKYQLEQLELVKEAIIQKDLPNTLTIDIIERIPVAVVKTSKNTYTVDKEGVIVNYTSNKTMPIIIIEYGLAINQNQMVDDSLLKTLAVLPNIKASLIHEIKIDKNREVYFTLKGVVPQFYIENKLLTDEFILKAERIGNTLTNNAIKTPKIIDIYSYDDTSIGFL